MFSRLLPLAYITLIEEKKKEMKSFSLIFRSCCWLLATTLLEFLISYTAQTFHISNCLVYTAAATQIARYIYFHLLPPVRTLDRL
jgi:hypothetical protein